MLLVLVATSLFATVMLVDRVMRAQAIGEEEAAAHGNAAILAAGLRSELNKFSLLPMALAEDPQVGSLVSGGLSQRQSLNARLEALAEQSDAAAIYVMDADGLTLAASNWDRPTSFVGSNYVFRPYFRDAKATGTATQFALGTVSRKPGLYIASRIGPASNPAGVVAVKVEFDQTEASWRRAARGVFVTDPDGVVLITSDASWRFHLAGTSASDEQIAVSDARKFGIARLEPLVLSQRSDADDVIEVPLLDAQQTISPEGWVLHLLADPGPRVAAAVATGRLALFLLLGLTLGLAFYAMLLRRRRQAREDMLVAERTRTLRDQLSQANRLATLGQISAGVNHEIGQPVAAVRVFAESGEKLIEFGRSEEATQNFREIVGLVDRIGQITGELRRFSRRQPGAKRAMPLGEIIDGALLLLRDRIVSMNATIELPEEELQQISVAAEHVKLEQVLVNLLQNALDAVAPEGSISIEIEPDANLARVRVIDDGPGIAADRRNDLFQPFATSKPDGLGLGLVISRDIMRDLGGDLIHEDSRSGTCFTMIVPRAS